MDKLVSIVIPTHNRCGFLPQSVESLLNQTYSHIEVVIVDDGSTDGTEDYVSWPFRSKDRLCPKTVVRGNGRRIEFRFQTGERRISETWSSDDDYYAPEAIARMVEVCDSKQDVGFVYAHYWVVEGSGQLCGRHA